MTDSQVSLNLDGEVIEYNGRSVAEAMGLVRLADLRVLAGQVKPGRVLIPGMNLVLNAENADAYGWVAIRAYELVALLNAAAMLDERIEASREEPEPSA